MRSRFATTASACPFGRGLLWKIWSLIVSPSLRLFVLVLKLRLGVSSSLGIVVILKSFRHRRFCLCGELRLHVVMFSVIAYGEDSGMDVLQRFEMSTQLHSWFSGRVVSSAVVDRRFAAGLHVAVRVRFLDLTGAKMCASGT